MEKTKKTTKTEKVENTKKQEIKYSYDEIFQSKKFKNKYQRDLAKVVMGDKLYTIKEAEDLLDKYFNKRR